MENITKARLQDRLKIIENHSFVTKDAILSLIFDEDYVKLIRKDKSKRKPLILVKDYTFEEMGAFLSKFIKLLDNIPTVLKRVKKSYGE